MSTNGAAEFFNRTGVIRGTRDNAAKALATEAVVLVFPGGDFDVYRPSFQENAINFGGRTGYVTGACPSAGQAGAQAVPDEHHAGDVWFPVRAQRHFPVIG
jgi:hypothetical protein